MADNSSGNGGLYFIVGALVVVVAVIFMVMTGHLHLFGDRHVDVHVEHSPAPAIKPGGH
ncbi:MAG TPA: hypothetical protein VND87_12545 [Stellaceae bacterium]|nr:hypothetical protein [Stellaceae bacterium]